MYPVKRDGTPEKGIDWDYAWKRAQVPPGTPHEAPKADAEVIDAEFWPVHGTECVCPYPPCRKPAKTFAICPHCWLWIDEHGRMGNKPFEYYSFWEWLVYGLLKRLFRE